MLEERSPLVVWAPTLALAGVPTVVAALAIGLIPAHIGAEGDSAPRARRTPSTNLAVEADSGDGAQEDEGAPASSLRPRTTGAAAPARQRARGFSPVVRDDPPPTAEAPPPPTAAPNILENTAFGRANNMIRNAEETRLRRLEERNAVSAEPPAIEVAAPDNTPPALNDATPPPQPVEEVQTEQPAEQ